MLRHCVVLHLQSCFPTGDSTSSFVVRGISGQKQASLGTKRVTGEGNYCIQGQPGVRSDEGNHPKHSHRDVPRTWIVMLH